jgi:tRNA A37 threonylcarbamoyladenosine dehydratase
MLNPLFQRLTMLTGPEAAAALEKSRVIVFGLGGVGSWCAEALARSGVGNISLVDSDTVCASNVNRQVQALGSTIGQPKTDALALRLSDINPACKIKVFPVIFSRQTAELFDIPEADYVIDAIDTLGCKLDLIEASAGYVRFFSSMGMANKLDPTLIRTADIWKTSGCPLARLVRQGLRKRNFSGHFTAVYSSEQWPCGAESGEPEEVRNVKKINGSSVTVTAAAGMVLASLVIRDFGAGAHTIQG